MFAVSVGSDSLTVNENETIINNATARSPYPRVGWFTNAPGSLFQLCKLKWICSCKLCPSAWYDASVCASSAVVMQRGCPENSSLVGWKGSCSGHNLTFERQTGHICHLLSLDCISTSPNPQLEFPFHHSGEVKGPRLCLYVWKATLVNNEELCRQYYLFPEFWSVLGEPNYLKEGSLNFMWSGDI